MLIPDRLELLSKYLGKCQSSGLFPGCCFGIITKDDDYFGSMGYSCLFPEQKNMKEDTIFDLASVTKVVATTTVIMVLIEYGELSLNDSVQMILPHFKHNDITILHLLTHTSGLPASEKFYKTCNAPEDIEKKLFNIDLIYKTGSKVIYSDLGFILLGIIIDKITGSLKEFSENNIFIPLNMHDTYFNPPPDKKGRCAATELKEDRGMVIGEVHDGNAYFMGGISGHAGLFSTVLDLANFIRMILFDGNFDNRQILTRNSIELMNRCFTSGLGECRGLGWQLKTTGSAIGDIVSENALYHTGFTGTSLLIDRNLGFGFALLTNRVHPTRENDGLIKVRSYINNMATASVALN